MDNLLRVEGIRTDFITSGKRVEAVVNGGFELRRGEIIGIVGESGSGKSVTMLSLLQLITPPGKVVGGNVQLSGVEENLLSLNPKGEQMRAVRGGRVGIIFQEPMTSLNPVLTVGFQITETILSHNAVSKEQAKQKAIETLKAVRIPDAEQRYNAYPQEFSGGMRQRIMIAIALAADPDILIADEATTALDVTIQAQLLEMLKELAQTRDVAIILVTHNMSVVARYADRIYVMYSGSVVEVADTRTLFQRPEHPYTRGLLAAIPRLNDPKDRVLVPIEGRLPDAANRAPYCAFYDRCPLRQGRCLELPCPALEEIKPGHRLACHLSMEERRLDVEKGVARAPERHISDEICLDVRNLSRTFEVRKGMFQRKSGEVQALQDVGFFIHKGETMGVVGESGCGKSTLARCITRALRPTQGEIWFNGRDIAQLSERKLRDVRREVATVFQDPFSSLDPRQTAESIVGESLKIHKLVNNQQDYTQRVEELFQLVELDPTLKHRMPHEFSGGQRQRIGIARALASKPKLIICDEPISALDVSVQAQIINLLEKLQTELMVSYLFIAHDLAVVRHISDRILVMYLGKVVEIADCVELYERPLHPYTQLLLSAVPTADPILEQNRAPLLIQGEIPSAMNRPSGCPFSDRCPHAQARCKEQAPPIRDLGMGHQVACYRHQ